MPRHVYGKANSRAVFAASTIFIDSSPNTATRSLGPRSEIPVANDEDASEEVVEIVEALRDLGLPSDGSESAPIRPGRGGVNSRHRDPKRYSQRHARPPGKEQVPSCDSEKENGEKSKSRPSPKKRTRRARPSREEHDGAADSASRNGRAPDPHIAPLLALTREQSSPLPFMDWSSELEPYFHVSKIAEASYSEVYRLSLLRPHATLTGADESVLKIIAVKPAQPGRSEEDMEREEAMTAVAEIASEVRLLKRMTTVPGFTNYRALHVLRGRPSAAFAKAWREWNKRRGRAEKSEFPDPGRKGSYSEGQYWAVIEMQDAGTDVERLFEDNVKARRAKGRKKLAPSLDTAHVGVDCVWTIWDIFWQTALAIAKGESEARFEHRDLHLGNVCVRASDGSGELQLARNARERRLGFTNLELTIIDYTLSRASMGSSSPDTSSDDPSSAAVGRRSGERGGEIAFHPLAEHPEIFQGDASQELQYQIYRDMRTIVRSATLTSPGDGKDGASDGEDWRAFHPRTNLVWLGYMLTKMLDYAGYAPESGVADPAIEERREQLWEILEQVADVLKTARIVSGEEELLVTSATELVELAAQEDWLGEADICG